MTKDDILKRIDELRPGGDDGDKRCLTNALDVCLFIEPRNACFSVDNSGNAKIFFACENHGYFTAKPEYDIWMAKGKDVIKIMGQTKGAMYVPPPEKDRSVNWDHLVAKAVVSNTRDDCFCRWTIRENKAISQQDTHLKMETAKF